MAITKSERILSYSQGVQAFLDGLSVDDNPHHSTGYNDRRYWWFMGYYDKKYEKLLAE